MTPAAFLARLARLSAAGDTPAALALVALTLDRLLDLGLDAECDLLFAQAEGVPLSPAVRRVFLVVTRPAKHRLPARRGYYERTARLMADELGAATAGRALRQLA